MRTTKAPRMRWYSVSFGYPGPHVGNPGDDPESIKASQNCHHYDSAIEAKLKEKGFQWAHAYSWPDGSCYKYVCLSEKTGGKQMHGLAAEIPGVYKAESDLVVRSTTLQEIRRRLTMQKVWGSKRGSSSVVSTKKRSALQREIEMQTSSSESKGYVIRIPSGLYQQNDADYAGPEDYGPLETAEVWPEDELAEVGLTQEWLDTLGRDEKLVPVTVRRTVTLQEG